MWSIDGCQHTKYCVHKSKWDPEFSLINSTIKAPGKALVSFNLCTNDINEKFLQNQEAPGKASRSPHLKNSGAMHTPFFELLVLQGYYNMIQHKLKLYWLKKTYVQCSADHVLFCMEITFEKTMVSCECICLGCYYDFNVDVTCLQLQLSRRRDEKVRWGNNRTFWNWMRICRPNFYTLIIIGMQTKLIRRTPLISLCRLSNNTITTHVLTFWLKVY